MEQLLNFFERYFYFELLDEWGGPVFVIVFILLFIAETFFWLRERKSDRWKRIITNVSLAVPGIIALRLVLVPVMVYLAIYAENVGVGLLNWLDLPIWLTYIAGFLLLDYINYLWHLLNHKWNFLWRFHNVHHIDLDLDITTAIRFHFGEILLSVFFQLE